jgi:hypothetical protein
MKRIKILFVLFVLGFNLLYNMKKKNKTLFTKVQRAFQREPVAILRSVLNGSFTSKIGLIKKELDQTVVKFKNKKGEYKILKTPVYYSSMFSCLLVLVMFTFTSVGCEKVRTLINGENNQTKITQFFQEISADSNGNAMINFITVAQGDLYGSGDEGIPQQDIIISTTTEWEKLKTAINSIAVLEQTTNQYFVEIEIDFNVYQAIAVFDNIHGNGGWSIDVTDVTEYSDKIVVSISNLKKGDITSRVTQPFHIVKIPASNKEIVFEHNINGE